MLNFSSTDEPQARRSLAVVASVAICPGVFEGIAVEDTGSYKAELTEIAELNFSLASAPKLFLSSNIRT